MKAAGLVGCALVVVAASGPRQPQSVPTNPTLLEAFEAVRVLVEFHGGPVEVIVIGPSIDETTAAVLKRERAAIQLKEVPAGSGLKLPARHLLLNSFQLGPDRGSLSATLGPVPAPQPGLILLACGTNFRIDLDRSSGKWHVKVVGLTAC